MATKPITPSEAAAGMLTNIPDEVIEAVNELVTERYRPRVRYCDVEAHEIITRAQKKLAAGGKEVPTNREFSEKGWLDFEPLFERAGWEVKYDRPGWDESYNSFFRFTKKDD